MNDTSEDHHILEQQRDDLAEKTLLHEIYNCETLSAYITFSRFLQLCDLVDRKRKTEYFDQPCQSTPN